MVRKCLRFQARIFLCTTLAFYGMFVCQKGALFAEDQPPPLNQSLGGTYTFSGHTSTPYLPVGCLDHRSLMFIVHEIEGDDPKVAQMLAERDCRPLLKDAQYLRCGVGGYAHPSKGGPLTYSAYCRKGAKDLQIYTLDIMMKGAQ